MYDLSYDIRHWTFAKILIFHAKCFLLYETGMAEVRLLNSEIKNYMIHIKQNLKNIFLIKKIHCDNTNNWREYLQQK